MLHEQMLDSIFVLIILVGGLCLILYNKYLNDNDPKNKYKYQIYRWNTYYYTNDTPIVDSGTIKFDDNIIGGNFTVTKLRNN